MAREDELFLSAKSGDIKTLRKFTSAGFLGLKKAGDLNLRDDNGYTLIHIAAENNQLEVVKFLLGNGMNIDERVDRGKDEDVTPLQLAIKANNIVLARFLIEKGASINTISKSGERAVDLAEKQGDKDFTAFLREKGGISDKDLLFAVEDEDLFLVKGLLHRGVQPNVVVAGKTPLSIAIYKRKQEIACLLIEYGAVIEPIVGVSGFTTPLHIAAAKGYLDLAHTIIDRGLSPDFDQESKMVLSEGEDTTLLDKSRGMIADPNVRDSDKRIPLHRVKNGTMASFFIEKGTDINAIDNEGKTPLYYAIVNNQLDVERVLIQSRANVNATDNEGRSQVHIAVINNDLEVIRFLTRLNANVDMADMHGYTPLMRAAGSTSINIVKLLMDNGAKINAKAADGMTPIAMAAKSGSIEIARLLIKEGANVREKGFDNITPLHIAAQNNNYDVLEVLIANGAELNAIMAEDHATPLHLAAVKGNLQICNRLVSAKANIDPHIIKPDAKIGFTPLLFAIENGHIDIVRTLIKNGASLEVRYGWAEHKPIDLANEKGFNEIVSVLELLGTKSDKPVLEAAENGDAKALEGYIHDGLSINVRNHKNKTPLHLACENGHIEAVKVLIKAGAAVNAVTGSWFYYPINGAIDNGHYEIVKFLIRNGADTQTPIKWYEKNWGFNMNNVYNNEDPEWNKERANLWKERADKFKELVDRTK